LETELKWLILKCFKEDKAWQKMRISRREARKKLNLKK
jgi:hypothetical protein